MGQARLDAPACSDWARRNAGIASNGDVAANGERANCVFRVEDDDKVGDVGTNLKTPSKTTCGNARGSGPGTVWETGDDKSGAGFSGEHETGFDHLEDGEA